MAASAILLVDDDPDTCASLSDIISDLGYRVDVADDGPAALELPRRHPYGLAFLDYKMQGTDGVELCGHLKRVHADTVGVPVTAFADDATAHAASRAGIRQVLSKAVEFGRLIPLIEEVGGTAGRSGAGALPLAPAHRRAFSFAAERGGAMPVLDPASAEPATSGPRELVDAAPVWPAASLRAPAEAGPLA
jgi:CheY-like chemotaxis protein